MNKACVKEFFDRCAPSWDAEMIRSDEIINKILDGAEVTTGNTVLDVACGTGVLFPDYLKRGVASVTGIDISPEMVRIARDKFNYAGISIVCGDVEETPFEEAFDNVMVYNAFPHFPDPKTLIDVLSKLVKPGGTLTVAHGMSREALEKHHSGCACDVSISLISEDELAALFPSNMEITVKLSDSSMYQVTGKRIN